MANKLWPIILEKKLLLSKAFTQQGLCIIKTRRNHPQRVEIIQFAMHLFVSVIKYHRLSFEKAMRKEKKFELKNSLPG